MIRFALIAASTLGFVLTAALGNLMVPLLRAFQRAMRPTPAGPGQEAPDGAGSARRPTMGGLCLMVGALAAVGVGWIAACAAQPELLGAESLLTRPAAHRPARGAALRGRGPAGTIWARCRSRSALGLRRHGAAGAGSGCRCRWCWPLLGEDCLPDRARPAGRGLCRLGLAGPAAVGRVSRGAGRRAPAWPTAWTARSAVRPLWPCWAS